MKKTEKLKDFGILLRNTRNDRKLYQRQLLRALHNQGYEKYSKGDVSKWERGYYHPPADVVETLEDVLKVPPGLLLDAANYREQAELRRQDYAIGQLKEYMKETLKLLAAANNLKFKDMDTGEFIVPSIEDELKALHQQIQPQDR